MTDDELEALQARMEDSFYKWHILTAQEDLRRLLAEVKRLRSERVAPNTVTYTLGTTKIKEAR